MAINWNREVTGKDVKKFFNQEIKLGEINYSKCLQVSLLVFALGIVPAFTYGLVLGTLDEQRVALMGEVGSLKAQVIGSSKESQIIYEARANSELYASNTPISISFNSATSTGVVKFDLLDGKSKLLQALGTTTTRLGVNTFTFRIATSTLATSDLFTVKVSLLNPQRVITTGKFSVTASTNPVTVNSKMIIYSVKNDKEVIIEKPAVVSTSKGFVEFSDPSGNYRLNFAGPNSEQLRLGEYVDAGMEDYTDKPLIRFVEGSTVTGGGTVGSFTVREIAYSNGKVTKAAIDYVMYGSGLTWYTYFGSVRFNSNIPVNKLEKNTFTLKSSAHVVPGDPALKQSDLGVIRYNIEIKAGASDMYVPNKTEFNLIKPETNGVRVEGAGISYVSIKSSPSKDDTAQAFVLKKGQTRNFTVDILVNPTTSNYYGAIFDHFVFGVSPKMTKLAKYINRSHVEEASPSIFLNAR